MADLYSNDGQGESPPSPLVFAVLGKRSPVDDDEIQFQTQPDVHWSARKACAALKMASSIVNAIVVFPGGDADEATLNGAMVELMERVEQLTSAAMSLLDIKTDTRNAAGFRNLLKQQAADVVAAQWRMAHSTKSKQLTTDQITKLYATMLATNPLAGDGELPAYPADIDAVTAKRVSLLGVAPEIFHAVNSFDYFTPDPQDLVIKSIEQIMIAAADGMHKLAAANASSAAMTIVTQSLIGKAGSLYATNFRAIARRDVQALVVMDPDERARKLYIHKSSGLPTGHIDASFHKLVDRMIEIVRDAVPELSQAATLAVKPVEKAQPSTITATNSPAPE